MEAPWPRVALVVNPNSGPSRSEDASHPCGWTTARGSTRNTCTAVHPRDYPKTLAVRWTCSHLTNIGQRKHIRRAPPCVRLPTHRKITVCNRADLFEKQSGIVGKGILRRVAATDKARAWFLVLYTARILVKAKIVSPLTKKIGDSGQRSAISRWSDPQP
ncbi:hypothetical protein BKA81DRAFT_86798 [Phyllosticta paracitricarpa]